MAEGCRRRTGGLGGTIGRWRRRRIGSVMVVLASFSVFMRGGIFGWMSFGSRILLCPKDRGAVKPLIGGTRLVLDGA
jgi:hypothetical protein